MDVLESLLVGLIVFVCAVFSVWRLMSLQIRLKVLEVLSRLPHSAGGGLAMMLRRRLLTGLSGGCGDCAAAAPSANARSLNRKSAAPHR